MAYMITGTVTENLPSVT